jgi:hypothetical protein
MSEEEKQEESKDGNPTIKENAQSTLETGTYPEQKTITNEQNNTISSTKESKPKKKRKPFDIRVDSQNSLKESKNKFKNTYSTESLK